MPAGVLRTFIWPAFRIPVSRATMCSRPTWSQSNPIQRIIECSLGRRWPHGNVPPPSCRPMVPPDRLSSPSQRHHLCCAAIICAALVMIV